MSGSKSSTDGTQVRCLLGCSSMVYALHSDALHFTGSACWQLHAPPSSILLCGCAAHSSAAQNNTWPRHDWMMPPAHAEHTSKDVIDVACCDVILIHAGQEHDITAAVMRLCHDIGHKPDTEAAAEKELQFSLQRVMAPAGALDDVVLTELPVRLQVLARRSRFLGNTHVVITAECSAQTLRFRSYKPLSPACDVDATS